MTKVNYQFINSFPSRFTGKHTQHMTLNEISGSFTDTIDQLLLCIYAINPKVREEEQRHVQRSVCPSLGSLLSELHLGANATLRRSLQHPCAQMDQNKCPPGRPQPVLPEPTLRLHSEPLSLLLAFGWRRRRRSSSRRCDVCNNARFRNVLLFALVQQRT